MVLYSLQYGVCGESITAFASYAMLEVLIEENYSAAKRWSAIVSSVAEKFKTKKRSNLKFET